MAQKTGWGVDIGNSAIKAIKMVRRGGDAVIVDFDIIDIQGTDDPAARGTNVRAALQSLISTHAFGGDPVFMSLPGDQCLFREFQLPPGSESKITELVIFEARQQIPFPLDQVEMGWEKFQDAGGGTGVELIVVRKNIVQEILDLTDQCGLKVQGLAVSPVAQFNFIQYEYNPQGPTLLLDAGYKGADFVIMEGRHISSRTIPIGGREITRALETKFKVPYDKAEEMKKNIAQSKQPDKIMSVIDPTLRQLGAEIQRNIGFYKSKSHGQRLQQGYLLGHTFRLPGMAEALAEQIREAPLTVVEGMRRIQLDPVVNADVFSNEFPTMAVAIGLGVQGLGLGELTVNLLPAERKTQIAVGRKRWWAALAAAAILAAMGVSYSQTKKAVENLKDLQTELDADRALANSEKKKVQEASQAFPAFKSRLENLARIARDRGRFDQVLGLLAALKDEHSRPFFGPASKVHLTGLYISRVPFNFESGALPEAVPALTGSRREMLKGSPALKGSSSIYAFLQKAKKPWEMAPEKRPDVPICVVLSGECEGGDQDLYRTLGALEAALLDLKGSGVVVEIERDQQIKRNLLNERRPGLSRKETVPNVTPEEKPFPDRPFEPERDIPYSVFHVIFRWNPPEDPDIVP